MEIELPLEIILHIYQYVTSDITLTYYYCQMVENERVHKLILTEYYGSSYIKEKSKIFLLEQVNTSKLETIKNGRLVCKSWAIEVVDVVNLTNCSFNYNSLIFNKLRKYGLSDEHYQSYRKFDNQLRIIKIRLNRHFNIMCDFNTMSRLKYFNYSYLVGPQCWTLQRDKCVEISLKMPLSYKCSLDIECYSSKYSDTDSVLVRKNKKMIRKTNDENSYLLTNDRTIYLSSKLLKRKSYRQNLLPKNNKMPKMKVHGKQCHH